MHSVAGMYTAATIGLQSLKWKSYKTEKLLEQYPWGWYGLSPVVHFFYYPTSWRSVRNFKTRTVISPQSGLMVMMHEGHYVHLQNSSSSFLFFRSWGWTTLCQIWEVCPLVFVSECKHFKLIDWTWNNECSLYCRYISINYWRAVRDLSWMQQRKIKLWST